MGETRVLSGRSIATRVIARPYFWLALVFLATVLFMPTAEPIFHWLFPGNPRPIYTRASFLELTIAHIVLAGISSAAAAVVGIGAGIFVTRRSGAEFLPLASAVAAIGQTFAPVAVLALCVPALGYGTAPTLVALGVYSVLPIFEYTVAGLRNIPESILDAGRGMGLSAGSMLIRVELPLASSFIMAGLRTAVVVNIGTAAIGSTVGALSLGSPIVEGLSASNSAYVIQGAVVVGLLGLLADHGFEILQGWLSRRFTVGDSPSV